MTHTKESLIAFEERVAQAFRDKRIRAPVHLSGGSEDQILSVFERVRPQDWVFAGWRSHYVALLKGIPEEEVFDAILAGRSMYLSSKEHKLYCSSIVGGILPIACGVAMGSKKLGLDERVYVFVGDMTSRTGLFFEFLQYCDGRELPVTVVIEDNSYSTNTPTEEVWGSPMPNMSGRVEMIRYQYARTRPHVGVGTSVAF